MNLCCLVNPYAICHRRSYKSGTGCGAKYCVSCAYGNVHRPPAWTITKRIRPINWKKSYGTRYVYHEEVDYDITVSYRDMRPDCPECGAACSVWSIGRITTNLDSIYGLGARWQ